MKSIVFAASALFLLAAAQGCAVTADGSDPTAQSEDEVVVATTAKGRAVQAFLADASVKSELNGRHAPRPQVLTLLAGSSFGQPVNQFFVATYVDVTHPGVMDASISKMVAATVMFPPGSDTGTVQRVDVDGTDESRASKTTGATNARTAIRAYLADLEVKNEIGTFRPSAPEAVVINQGSSFGATVTTYLVASIIDTTPPGLFDARFTHAIPAFVTFQPGGGISVSLAEVKDLTPAPVLETTVEGDLFRSFGIGGENTGASIKTANEVFELVLDDAQRVRFVSGQKARLTGKKTLLSGVETHDRSALLVSKLLVCPVERMTINCMPPVAPGGFCSNEDGAWLQANCANVLVVQ